MGADTYNFRSTTSLSPHFTADPTEHRQSLRTRGGQFDASQVPEDADSQDIIAILREEQRLELEEKLNDVHDDHQRSFIIYQSAVTFQQRLSKLRSFRKEQKRVVIDQVQTALTTMKENSTQLSLLDLVSLLRGVSVGDPYLQLYSLDHISSLHDYMLFFSCRDQPHLSLVANAVVDFISTHPKFNMKEGSKDNANKDGLADNADGNNTNNNNTNDQDNTQKPITTTSGMSKVNFTSKRAKALLGKSGETMSSSSSINDKNTTTTTTDDSVNNDLTNPKYSGRKFGELLVFSRHDLPWRVVDLGSVLLHLSYGPERKLSDMESVLSSYSIPLDQRTTQNVLSTTRLHKCLEITPVSMLEDEAVPVLSSTPTPTPHGVTSDNKDALKH